LCNVITGHAHDSDIFPVSAEAVSCTQSTQFANIFFNDDKRRPIDVIDTIGFDDPKNDTDADIIGELVHMLKHNCDYVNLFMIAVNGQNPRLDGALMGMIRIFEGMFGEGFWKQAVIVFTRVSMDEKNKKKREKNTKQTDDDLAKKYLKVVEEAFPRGQGLQYLFIDACYDEEDSKETDAFKNALEDLWESLQKASELPTTKVREVETESKKLKNAIEEKEKERQLILQQFEEKQLEWKKAQEELTRQHKEEARKAEESQAKFLENMAEERKKIEQLKSELEINQSYEKQNEKEEIENKMRLMEQKHQRDLEKMERQQKEKQDNLNRKIQQDKEEFESKPGVWTNLGRVATAVGTLGLSEVLGKGKKWFGGKKKK